MAKDRDSISNQWLGLRTLVQNWAGALTHMQSRVDVVRRWSGMCLISEKSVRIQVSNAKCYVK